MLILSDIHKRFDDVVALDGVDLRMERGDILCLLGPSGCGKTTLLRIIAGLETPDQGRVLLEGRDITHAPPHRRGFGLMFQDYALFPHMSVADNIAFGLKMQGRSAKEVQERVAELLEMVDLVGFEQRKVFELSGGQQQRVALARSLAPKPRLLMLDEPLGSLDRLLRDQLLTELRQLLQSLNQTALYVTHDQEEAFAIADRVALMNRGRVEQEATPAQLYLRPATVFAARFLGFKNILSARVLEPGPAPLLDTRIGPLRSTNAAASLRVGQQVRAVIRPEGAKPAADLAPMENRVHLRLMLNSFRGAHTVIQLSSPHSEEPLEFELPGFFPIRSPGEEIALDIAADAIVVLVEDDFGATS